jgi:hypothetical protein
MPYARYLRLEGWCSIVLGLALALVAFPGLLLDYAGAAWALAFVPAVLLALGAWAALRHGIPLARPGRWLTHRPLAGARPGRAALDPARLRRRLLAETAIWIAAVTAWVVMGASDGLLILGTGLASAAFGAVQAFAATARVRAVEAARGERYVVARRPGLGTPELAVASAGGSGGPTAAAGSRTGRAPSGTTRRTAPRAPARPPSPSPPPGRT